MSQFMCEEFLPGRAGGIVLAIPEEDILSGSEGPGLQRFIQIVSLRISVDCYAREIRAKGFLHG